MSISALPTPPSTSSPGTFDALADAFLGALPTFQTEANALAAQMTAASAGGAVTIGYTFSTTTTDSDPGNGTLRLDNATQNAATTIRMDLLDASGTDWTSVLDTFDASSSTVKGLVRLSKAGDGTKWIVFSLSARAAPSGYRNMTVAVVAASSASPFANSDPLLVQFSRTGDKGATGNTGAAGADGADGANSSIIYLSTVTASGAATADIETTFNSTYNAYLLVATDVFPSTTAKKIQCRLKIGGSYLSTNTYRYQVDTSYASAYAAVSSQGAAQAELTMPLLNGGVDGASFQMLIPNPAGAAAQKMISVHGGYQNNSGYPCIFDGVLTNTGTGAMTGIRFFADAGNINGTFRLYGIVNS